MVLREVLFFNKRQCNPYNAVFVLCPTSSFCFSSFSSRNLDTFTSLRMAASLPVVSEKDKGFALYRS